MARARLLQKSIDVVVGNSGMTVLLLVLLWLVISILEDLALAKMGIAYLRFCVPIWRTSIVNSVSSSGKRSRWLIPLTRVRLTDKDYLLRETYKVKVWFIYPIFCYGHLVLGTSIHRLQVRLKWSAFIVFIFLAQLLADIAMAVALLSILLLAIFIQCVRFRNESKRLLAEQSLTA